jgi:hypothetical protein
MGFLYKYAGKDEKNRRFKYIWNIF